ncbi:Histidine--tRNA ligase [uncultured Desulfobacterium sp.]|uniref:Histidine--tRNA ligase n=1 Tax=uncultured Desulfobacterium sp. TaxID=201089 RepID=A0A445N185_9BACT|nr:Histidine--tRNA ligase [uncultured Desulfobacterium sp.]
MELTAIKGFKDILPDEVGHWQRLESIARSLLGSYGFQEIKTPVMEYMELFSRGIGQETDIVSKEMYTLHDSRGRGMTLRPEATASVVRAYVQHRLDQKGPIQKLFSIGPMFRHERPQKGRFRQFHQINAEMFGDAGPKSDADIIVMAVHLFEMIGISDLTLNLNSLGCPECRPRFREELSCYLKDLSGSLCPDCQRRAVTNPLRVFDCKVESCGNAVINAPSVVEFLCGACVDHFESLKEYLGDAGVEFTLNHRLVRGLDYYNRTTFEIQTNRLGAQNAVAGGGRYDGLVRLLSGPDQPAIGFAVGMERVIALLEEGGRSETKTPGLFIAGMGDEAERLCFKWAAELRRSGIWVEMDYAQRGLKSQMKKAGRIGARKVLIIGGDELARGKALLKDMDAKEQHEIEINNIIEILKKVLNKND